MQVKQLVNFRKDANRNWQLQQNTESFIIPSSRIIQLNEIPDDGSVKTRPQIAGLTEIYNINKTFLNPNSNQFWVNYGTGEITFNVSKIGQNISVTYWGKGSPLTADYINTIATNLQELYNNSDLKMYTKRTNFVDDIIYKGEAEPGTNENSSNWRIKKIIIQDDLITELFPNGQDSFSFKWSDHLTLNYS
jgi:hypothetical protein